MSEPSTELLLCPMCGARPKHRYTLNAGFSVFCVCGIQTGYSEERQAVIEAWNQRANRWSAFSDEELREQRAMLQTRSGDVSNTMWNGVLDELTRRAAAKQKRGE